MVASAKNAIDHLQCRDEIYALTKAVKVLYDYGPAFKEFPDIAQNLINQFNALVDVFHEGIKPNPTFGNMMSEHLSFTLVSVKTDISDEQTSIV